MPTITLRELAGKIGATVDGDEDAVVTACAPIDKAGPGELAFLANAKYAKFLSTTQATGVLVGEGIEAPPTVTRLIAPDPYFAFRNAMIELHGFRKHPPPMDAEVDERGRFISPRASIHPRAALADGVAIHPFAVVEAGASIGRNTVLYPGCFVGEDAVIGEDTILHPNVAVYDRCVVGNRVTLHSSTVIGQDGFGYATHAGAHHKIPQAGIVVVEDDVELGAGCAIERAAMGETRIGQGTKFADLISIGHGTTIGKHCLFVSFVGVSGSVDVGNYVVLGGQVGITGHLKIGDGVQAMARSAIVRDVAAGSKVGGAPAVPAELARRNVMVSLDLYELAKRVRELEKQVKDLTSD